jgi:hypothetical protein
MMERVGLVYVVHHSLAILNHIKAVEYSSNYVAANVINITGVQMTERFQQHRSFDYLPSVVAEKFKLSIIASSPKVGPASQRDGAIGIDKGVDGAGRSGAIDGQPCRLPQGRLSGVTRSLVPDLEGMTGVDSFVDGAGLDRPHKIPKKVSFARYSTQKLVDFDLPVSSSKFPEKKVLTNSATKRDYLNFFFSNITVWGPQTKSLVFSDDFKTEYHVVGLVETHTTVESNLDMISQARAQGFTADANVAMKYSSTAGNHGGECVFASRNTFSIPIDPVVIESTESSNDCSKIFSS